MKSWDPFRDLLTIQDRMNKLFETVLTGPVPMDPDGDPVGAWRPTAEVVETPEALEIECELAGLSREQVEVRVDGQFLVIQGDRSRDLSGGASNVLRLERPYGRFSRRFELVPGLDLENVRAALENGILRVTLPKRPESRARTIAVTS